MNTVYQLTLTINQLLKSIIEIYKKHNLKKSPYITTTVQQITRNTHNKMIHKRKAGDKIVLEQGGR